MSKIYIISDTHLNHTNILQYCNRPFKAIEEMNKIIVNNWNNTITDNDIVYFLGDLCMGDPKEWVEKLNGNKIFIRGNHDKLLRDYYKYKIIKFNDEKILLIHNPDFLPFKWNKWIIHGHHHNHFPEEFPLINNQNKTINVSVEMTNYKPVNLYELLNKRSIIK